MAIVMKWWSGFFSCENWQLLFWIWICFKKTSAGMGKHLLQWYLFKMDADAPLWMKVTTSFTITLSCIYKTRVKKQSLHHKKLGGNPTETYCPLFTAMGLVWKWEKNDWNLAHHILSACLPDHIIIMISFLLGWSQCLELPQPARIFLLLQNSLQDTALQYVWHSGLDLIVALNWLYCMFFLFYSCPHCLPLLPLLVLFAEA